MSIMELEIDQRLDQHSTLKWTMPADDPKAELILADAMCQYQDVMYYIAEIEQDRSGTEATISVTANELWMRLGERKYVGSMNIVAQTLADGIDTILAAYGTTWTRGPNTAAGGSLFSYEAQDESFLSLLLGWAKVTNTVVTWNTYFRTVDLVPLADRGVDRGISFRYGRNLTNINRHVEPPKVTRLYPFGRNDLTIEGVEPSGLPYIEDYTFYTAQGVSASAAAEMYRKDDLWSDQDIIDDQALYDAAVARLSILAAGIIEYKMDVVDLSALSRTDEGLIEVGDIVRVRDTALGFNVTTTVVRLQKYPMEPWRNKVELAYLYDPTDGSGSTTRPQSSLSWEMFQDRSNRIMARNNGIYLSGRIPLAFADRAEAVYGVDLSFVGVGTGSLSVSAVDASSGYLLEHDVVEIPYTDGESVHRAITWSHDSDDPDDSLNGEKDYRIRIKAIPTAGGASSASGIEVPEFGGRFWILARGAVKREPTSITSVRYDYTGEIQTFTVPDSVEEITIEAYGAAGGANTSDTAGTGGRVQATFNVLPGSTYDVYVGGRGGATTDGGHGGDRKTAGWPNGGTGATGSGGSSVDGYGGGGSSHVVPAGGSFSEALIVAGAGGGSNRIGPSRGIDLSSPGNAGFFEATAGAGRTGTAGEGGGGATQVSGGAAGVDTPGFAGSFGQGASGVTTDGNFDFCAGGGGGGWYGGGCAGSATIFGGGQYAGDGGGGSGYVATELGYDIDFTDATNTGDGYIIVSWRDPAI